VADIPIEDGSDKPIGYQTPDGELEVRAQPEGGTCYYETDLGQHQRWMRQAPDLFEKHQNALSELDALRLSRAKLIEKLPLGCEHVVGVYGWCRRCVVALIEGSIQIALEREP